jgi:hypothetical protein
LPQLPDTGTGATFSGMHHGQQPSNDRQSLQRARRSDAGKVRLTPRDLDALTLIAEQYAAPYDLLAAYLEVTESRLRGITARWRNAGLADTGILSAGPAWCWLTPEGMRHAGYPWRAEQPPMSRLAHIRAVLACRLTMQSGPAWQRWHAQWTSERHLRAETPGVGTTGHVPDAEVTWPNLDGSPRAGEQWAIEVELTPKPHHRTQVILTGLLAQPYHRILYLCTPQANTAVTRAIRQHHPDKAARVTTQPLPPAAPMPPATRTRHAS